MLKNQNPLGFSGPDPKSGVSTNFTTGAALLLAKMGLCHLSGCKGSNFLVNS